jgi:hypothetical protein
MHPLADKNLITILFKFEECGTKKRLAQRAASFFISVKQQDQKNLHY